MVENTSGLRPLGRAVLVEYWEPERKKSTIIIPESHVDRVNAVEQRARVIEVGPACWPEEPMPRAKAGDYVLISRMAGYQCDGILDKKKYRFINDRDVFAALTPEAVYTMEAQHD